MMIDNLLPMFQTHCILWPTCDTSGKKSCNEWIVDQKWDGHGWNIIKRIHGKSEAFFISSRYISSDPSWTYQMTWTDYKLKLHVSCFFWSTLHLISPPNLALNTFPTYPPIPTSPPKPYQGATCVFFCQVTFMTFISKMHSQLPTQRPRTSLETSRADNRMIGSNKGLA